MNLIVLKENRQSYQPTAQEIYEYGGYLGLKFPEDQKFTPLLYEALRAPLPPGWEACENTDQQGSIVYRNKMTQQVQYDHPLDDFYKERIIKIKRLTQNLQIETILEEKESWLKDSSQMFGKSKDSEQVPSPMDKKGKFIDLIQQEKSIFDQELQKQQLSQRSISQNGDTIIINKAIKSPRIYTKAKKQVMGTDKLKSQLMNYKQIPSFTAEEIKSKNYPRFKSAQENNKMKQIIALNEKIEGQKQKMKKLQIQRKRKLNYLQCLKNQIKIMHN